MLKGTIEQSNMKCFRKWASIFRAKGQKGSKGTATLLVRLYIVAGSLANECSLTLFSKRNVPLIYPFFLMTLGEGQ